MSFVVRLTLPPAVTRARLLDALGLEDEGGETPSPVLELGRAATGSTAALIREDEGGAAPAGTVWSLVLPLIRAPWSARDLVPTVASVVRTLGGTVDPAEPLEAWQLAHARACHELAAVCESQGTPPPPFLPAAELEALHAWLLVIDAAPDAAPASASDATGASVSRTVFCLDPHDGSPTRLAVRLPRVAEAATARLPPLGFVLADLDDARTPEVPLLYPLEAVGGVVDAGGFVVVDVKDARARLASVNAEALARFRIVSPVEIVDVESLAG